MQSHAEPSGPSRRALLGGVGATVGAVGMAAMSPGTATAAAAVARPPSPGDGMRLVLLGTAAGRTWWDGSRQGIASAVVVGDATYLIDCGDGWARQYLRAGLGQDESVRGLEHLRAVFLTHLHADHIVDLPDLFTFGLFKRTQPVKILGPGARGKLVPLSGDSPAPPVINPDNPTPGTADTVDLMLRSYAADLNDNMRDSRMPDPRSIFVASDIELPDGVTVDPDQDPAPVMSPFTVYEDDRVRVSATLVDHAPVFPAYAFRFDSDHGSIVFSGDTTVCDNLVDLARDADILVHEVIDRRWVEERFQKPLSPADEAKVRHLLESHTELTDVGGVAERCGVRHLVLSHLAPADNPKRRWLEARHGFSGKLHVGEELMELTIKPGRLGVPTRQGG